MTNRADRRRMGTVARCGLAGLLVLAAVAPAESEPRWQLGGRLQIDAGHFDSDLTPLENDVILRRARLKLSGRLAPGWQAKLQYELADGTAQPKSIWAAYGGGGGSFELKIGHQKAPFGLQQTTSSRYNTFMERALPNVFSPGYQVGVLIEDYNGIWTGALGVFAGGLDEKHELEDEGLALLARVFATPQREEGRLLHLGGSFEQRELGSDTRLRLRSRPETRLTDVRFVDTRGINDVERTRKYGLEAAAIRGPMHMQAEYIAAHLQRDGGPALDFDGWYAQAGWFLTGESRRYGDGGVFRSVRPLRPGGAWELALRLSDLDLSDQEIEGGHERNFAFALNWYPRDFARLSLNYIFVDADPTRDGGREQPRILQLRFQLHN